MRNDLDAKTIETALVKVLPIRGPGGWTVPLLDAIAKLGRDQGRCVDPREPRGTRAGEFLWDLTISRWPPTSEGWYDASKIVSPEIDVVVESEWGKARSHKATRTLVIDDFAKLVAARAATKVMIFGYHGDTPDDLTDFMCDVVDKCDAAEKAEYLLFGAAWSGTHYCSRIHQRGRKPRDRRAPVPIA